jgi:hypothetical protein
MARLITEPVDFLLGPSGDLVLPLRFARGMQAVAQRVRIRLQMFRGEWFLDLDKGVAYLIRNGVTQAILGEKYDPVFARNEFRDAILFSDAAHQVPDTEILLLLRLDISFDRPTRDLQVAWQLRTVFGDTPLDTLAPGSVTA